jgi:phage terminase large subunit-like protein
VPVDKQLLLDNPDLFLATYFSHRLNHKLETFHLQLIKTATEERRGLVLYPAAHGKTTIVSTLLPIWALCNDPNIRISIITKNDRDAKGIMQAIMAELLGNEELIADFGPFHTDDRNIPWGLEKLSVAKRTRRAKEPTIMAFGSGSNTALGSRADWVICDDIVTEKNSATPDMRIKLKEWFQLGPETQAEEYDDRLTVVGTLFDPSDLYHDLIELVDPSDGVPIWHVDRFDAVTDEEEHKTLWPGRWPWKRLMMEKASKGTLSFNKRYRNIAVDPSRMVFREEYIKGDWVGKTKYPGCLDKTFVVGDVEAGMCHRVVAGFDPAVGTSRNAKFCAHIIVGKGFCATHPEGCFWVIDLKRDQLTMPQQMDYIINTHLEYSLFASFVETNAFQKGMFQGIQERLTEQGLALKIESHQTDRHNKHDPEIGIQQMSPIFENGHVHIPWGNPESQRKMSVFVDELVQYPGKTTDTVMAFWFAWLALKERTTFSSVPYLKKELAWMPAGRRVIKNPYFDTPTREGENGQGGGTWTTTKVDPRDGGPIPMGTR